MNKNEIAEIQDVIGMLGDMTLVQDQQLAEECAEKLFALIKPFIEADIKVGDEHK